MTITSVDIDREKIELAKAITGASSVREVVDIALNRLIEADRFDPATLADRIQEIHEGTLRRLADR
ncbi:type II toxin-antitoxin system VapB family antitoxin [Cnuibacter sp. UC19_7]|uniref:type II toxin-antitoxin system VapB family antitoxin n=1 Tax=Cnuibacter sp. UC19_7 TaxID=3350166 RepID=UPI00367078C2